MKKKSGGDGKRGEEPRGRGCGGFDSGGGLKVGSVVHKMRREKKARRLERLKIEWKRLMETKRAVNHFLSFQPSMNSNTSSSSLVLRPVYFMK